MIRTIPAEKVWARVRRWARRNGHAYKPGYGIEGVAPM